MLGIKRCYGCGRIIWLWQDIINTKKVGIIHNERSCILDAWYKLSGKGNLFGSDLLLLEALSALEHYETKQ